jgi:hypothetical protein
MAFGVCHQGSPFLRVDESRHAEELVPGDDRRVATACNVVWRYPSISSDGPGPVSLAEPGHDRGRVIHPECGVSAVVNLRDVVAGVADVPVVLPVLGPAAHDEVIELADELVALPDVRTEKWTGQAAKAFGTVRVRLSSWISEP